MRLNRTTGDLGLPYSEVDGVTQAMARMLIDRGFPARDVSQRLAKFANTSVDDRWWDRWAGPATDELAYALGYDQAFPKEEP